MLETLPTGRNQRSFKKKKRKLIVCFAKSDLGCIKKGLLLRLLLSKYHSLNGEGRI